MKIDLDELELKATAAKSNHPWRVYRCGGAASDEACGIKAEPFVCAGKDAGYHGVVFDTAYDECHHHMAAVDAEHIAANSPPVTLALVARIQELEATVRIAKENALDFGDVQLAEELQALLKKGVVLP